MPVKSFIPCSKLATNFTITCFSLGFLDCSLGFLDCWGTTNYTKMKV